MSAHKTEGNGVGDLTVPPVKLIDLEGCRRREDKPVAALNGWDVGKNGWQLSVNVRVCDAVNFVWETVVIGRKLFVEVPKFILPDGSKERYAFITICAFLIFLTCTDVMLHLLNSEILNEIVISVKGSSSVFVSVIARKVHKQI